MTPLQFLGLVVVGCVALMAVVASVSICFAFVDEVLAKRRRRLAAERMMYEKAWAGETEKPQPKKEESHE